MMRLNKYLAQCGLGSRRKCELYIQAGRVAVDGTITRSLATTIDENKNVITVDGKQIYLPHEFKYVLLNKPKDCVTTTRDELGRKTVLDLVPQEFRLFPVGRLDKDTTGALLLTNDGDLAFQLMHPRFNVDKKYQVLLNKSIIRKDIRKLQSGILLEDGLTGSCNVSVIRQDRKTIEIIIHEGRKRQIRRMLKALNYKVVHLTRTQYATLTLAGLKPGEWRYLTREEIAGLKKLTPGNND